MALTESQLNTRIAALRNARDAGVLIVRHGDTSTQFRTLAEMNAILSDLEGELAKVQGVVRSRVNYVKQCTKGL